MAKRYDKPQHVRVVTPRTETVRTLNRPRLLAAIAAEPLPMATAVTLEDLIAQGRYDKDDGTLLHHLSQYARCERDEGDARPQLCDRCHAGEFYDDATVTVEDETWEWVPPDDPRVDPVVRAGAAAERATRGLARRVP